MIGARVRIHRGVGDVMRWRMPSRPRSNGRPCMALIFRGTPDSARRSPLGWGKARRSAESLRRRKSPLLYTAGLRNQCDRRRGVSADSVVDWWGPLFNRQVQKNRQFGVMRIVVCGSGWPRCFFNGCELELPSGEVFLSPLVLGEVALSCKVRLALSNGVSLYGQPSRTGAGEKRRRRYSHEIYCI